ncbi:FMN-linked oxidoreductase [Wallemia mellicola CBS 633.66]|uniref:FMN-linked oxidoreductase n=2 Tax=Wallemia mellicola TaxID=1708541 RepID=A0A4T0LQZ1_9BASI|nr:FMN-linked oxidoreductase [Wallemia mellicola CBS 633.66]EIM20909.1 FMN-linked oxidoreductase [Wallemia mellicola CBS 633.66]TIB72334.1 hypothetical protein E3Q23_03423 [Wallemia mellicola]TIC28002.1 FMN-linked oxidoreductase [Wallemia mellicola]TIC63408.1 FMN-linked oxidoreductase [Wallemia mellicola]|eukprot:XP_006959168.1 FMN-linked oxidoreductase [Wallemia mellicola CBS 633.66]
MTIHKDLFKEIRIGDLNVEHRIIHAPLTRMRTQGKNGILRDYVTEYYKQRTTKNGLLIGEACVIAEEAHGLDHAPGIYNEEQIAAWKNVTNVVHQHGGYFFAQIFALGRVAVPEFLDAELKGPSDDVYRDRRVKEMSVNDIERFIGHFKQAATNCINAAKFDGVEIHGANGYLVDQFIQKKTNRRTDAYAAHTLKFPKAVLAAVVDAIGEKKTAIRISAFSAWQGMREDNPMETFVPWCEHIVSTYKNLAYVHFVDPLIGSSEEDFKNSDTLKKIIKDGGLTVISNTDYSLKTANERAAQPYDEGVAFGKLFISNPDLPHRALKNHPLNENYDRTSFYGGTEVGYIDYPYYQ